MAPRQAFPFRWGNGSRISTSSYSSLVTSSASSTITGCTTTSLSSYSAGNLDGSRGEGRVLLRTSRNDFYRFKGWVYFEHGDFDVPVDFFCFLVFDLVVLNMILSFLDINGWKLGKIVRDLEQTQKGISYLLVVHERSFSRHTRKRNAYLFVVVFPILPFI